MFEFGICGYCGIDDGYTSYCFKGEQTFQCKNCYTKIILRNTPFNWNEVIDNQDL